jgi:hypothetical protein
MPGAPAKLTQADVARAIRAAQSAGMTVRILTDGSLLVVPMPETPATPAPAPQVDYRRRKRL